MTGGLQPFRHGEMLNHRTGALDSIPVWALTGYDRSALRTCMAIMHTSAGQRTTCASHGLFSLYAALERSGVYTISVFSNTVTPKSSSPTVFRPKLYKLSIMLGSSLLSRSRVPLQGLASELKQELFAGPSSMSLTLPIVFGLTRED